MDTTPPADKHMLDTEVDSTGEEAGKEVPSDDANSFQREGVDYTSELLELLQESKVEEIQGVDAEEAKKIKQFQEASKVLTTFSAKRTLVLPLREPMASDNRPKVPVEEYLKDPERLVKIVYNDTQFEKLASDKWRIKLLAIRILSWSVVPVYELTMRFEDSKLLAQSGTVSLDPKGLPSTFEGMELLMRLYCVTEVTRPSNNGTCQLDALADLQIAADLPGILKRLPGVQSLGNSILDTILAAIEIAAKLKLEKDYLEFVEERLLESPQLEVEVLDPTE